MRKVKVTSCPSNPELIGTVWPCIIRNNYDVKLYDIENTYFLPRKWFDARTIEIEDAGKISIKTACRFALKSLQTEFYIVEFVAKVRQLTERPALMDGTITRRLRELKEDNIINYEIIDSVKCIYKRLPVPEKAVQRNIIFEHNNSTAKTALILCYEPENTNTTGKLMSDEEFIDNLKEFNE